MTLDQPQGIGRLWLPRAERSIHTLGKGPSCISHADQRGVRVPSESEGRRKAHFILQSPGCFHSHSEDGGSCYLLSHPEVALPDLL